MVFQREGVAMASASAGLPPLRAPPSRPREIEDPLNRFVYHPLARRLALGLRPTGISPNAVSVGGMLLVWGAAAAYVGLGWPASLVTGFTLHLLWHVVDGADGDLARLTGKSTPTGELVDGLCDYAGHFVLYWALAILLYGQIGHWAWPLGAAAAASRIVQANHAESQRRYYLWWVYGVPWLKHARAGGDEQLSGGNWISRTFGGFGREYLKLANRMTPFAPAIDAAIEGARHEPARRRRIARWARHSSRRALAFQKLLGSNPRTVILGVSMAFGTPLYFFVTEIVLMNLLLAWSLAHHNAVAARMVARLG